MTEQGDRTLLEADDRRHAAMVLGNIPDLDEVLHPDLVYVHSSGRVESKPEYLASLAEGRVKYVSLERSTAGIHHYERTAVMHGRLRLSVASADGARTFTVSFVSTWTRDFDKWRLCAWASPAVREEPIQR